MLGKLLERFRPKTKLGLGVAIGLAFSLWPILILPLFIGARLLVLDDSAVGELMSSFGLALLILTPLSLICGAIVLLLCGAIWGAGLLKTNRRIGRFTRPFVGTICASLLIVSAYIPAGSDPCSRSITDEGYQACVSDIIVGMSVSDARKWLEEQGYRNTINVEQGSRARKLDGYDSAFEALRSYGPYRSIPYGTNFFRLFGRIPPAPSHFELVIRNSSTDDKVVSVQVWWAFSFL